MSKRAPEGRRWRIGELAEAAGLTVRALRHYEQRGLLGDVTRSGGRQREYDERDARRVFLVRALRDLGLPLAEIARVLENASALADVLRDHEARLGSELRRLQRRHAIVEHARALADEPSRAHDPLETIEAMSQVLRARDHEQARVERRDDDPSARERAWRALGDDLLACLPAGEPPSATRTLVAARAIRARIRRFAGDAPSTMTALAHLRRHASPRDLAGWSPAMMRYLDDALTILDGQEAGTC